MKWWKTYQILSAKKKQLRWSAEEIKQYRSSRLPKVVSFAYHNSPFYRAYYEQCGVHPDHIRGEEDLKKLPILEKETLRRTDPLHVLTARSENGSPNEQDLMVEITSGSTGEPLEIRRTWRDLYCSKANDIRAFQQTGLRLYHRQVVLKSSAVSVTGRHWFENFGILRKYWLAVTEPPERNLARLKKIRPQHLHGYPNGLLEIADFLQSRNQTFKIPVICTGAEVLDAPMRRKISEAFQAEVFDLYGTREVANIAWECRAHQGLHINDDAIILELLDEEGREVPVGEEGEVVVTHLDLLDYPFIRYRLGDRAIRLGGACPCGVAFSRLNVLTGRSDARIRLRSGQWLTGMVFQEIRTLPWLASFRVIQESTESIRLQIVPKYRPQQRDIEALVEQASDLVKRELKVIPEILDKLDPDASGKVRAVICRLPLEADADSHSSAP